jgi:hypothetical protein
MLQLYQHKHPSPMPQQEDLTLAAAKIAQHNCKA